MYRVIMRAFQYYVVNGQGVTCAGPFATRHEAQFAADGLNRSRGF
jgi:hypothetical protein